MNRLSGVQTEAKDRIVGLYSQAHGLAMGGRYAEALELYDRIIADAPGLVLKAPRINYERALCLKALGRLEQAEDKGHLAAIRSESTEKDNTISKRDGPIVVYQMGKVGSVSVYESLKASGVGVPIYHVHYLTRDGIERITPGHQAAHLLRNQIDKGFGGTKWRIVSSVREPVARNISAFFQNIDKWYPNFSAHCKIGSVDVEGLIKLFLEKYPHDTPLMWFDSEMKSVFGIDVFAYDFPKSEGYKIYRAEHADLLLMRLEDMNERIGEAFKEFLGIDRFTLSDANVSSGKEYHSVYREFVDSVILPESYVERMYSSKYARHFYGDLELNRFKRKWTVLKHADVKPCQENRAPASSSRMGQEVMGAGGASRTERALVQLQSVPVIHRRSSSPGEVRVIAGKEQFNLRAMVIDLVMETVLASSPSGRFNALEVGCMFKADEGLSTYRIAHFVSKCDARKQFVSIDYEPEHISACERMLTDVDTSLLSGVKFVCGRSLAMLPAVLEDMGTVDFALLDGGAEPGCCLREFQLIVRHLSDGGLVVVDDVQDMKPTAAYPLPRPFGKGTLILPCLIIAEYLSTRDLGTGKHESGGMRCKDLGSGFISHSSSCELFSSLGQLRYMVVSEGNHKVLVVGSPGILCAFGDSLAASPISLRVELMPACTAGGRAIVV
jgi:predicted O-methyltransferase YrrM